MIAMGKMLRTVIYGTDFDQKPKGPGAGKWSK